MSRYVVKLGSALLTQAGLRLNEPGISDWTRQISGLIRAGHQVVVVSSGAVAAGLGVLGLTHRPSDMPTLQAAAAAGQSGLATVWETCFRLQGLAASQILLTHDDLSDRGRYLNARATLLRLMDFDVVPVVNENDTVVTEEIRFGDNDTLAALVANLIQADTLIILTDQQGMYRQDPRVNPDAELLTEVNASDRSLDAMASGGTGSLGRGGMVTKVRAARLAARSGAETVIAHGKEPDIIARIARKEAVGTRFTAPEAAETARKRWLAGHLRVKGSVTLDAGAVEAVLKGGRSVLPVGVVEVEGDFHRGEAIAVLDGSGRQLAVGLVNYDAQEARLIQGVSSRNLSKHLAVPGEPELIHCDNLALR
ncbi:MAG: glutamate 5-kinase [Litorivicinus sp.]